MSCGVSLHIIICSFCNIEHTAQRFSAFQQEIQSIEFHWAHQGYSECCPPSFTLNHILFSHTRTHKRVSLSGLCLYGHDEWGWKVEKVKGLERSTHPFLFSVRVQLVVHRLNHTAPANTQTAHNSLLRVGKQLPNILQCLFILSKCVLIWEFNGSKTATRSIFENPPFMH